MKTNRVCNDSSLCEYIMKVDNSWTREVNICRSCQLSFLALVKKKFHPTASFESVISYNIVLFETAEDISQMNELKQNGK